MSLHVTFARELFQARIFSVPRTCAALQNASVKVHDSARESMGSDLVDNDTGSTGDLPTSPHRAQAGRPKSEFGVVAWFASDRSVHMTRVR